MQKLWLPKAFVSSDGIWNLPIASLPVDNFNVRALWYKPSGINCNMHTKNVLSFNEQDILSDLWYYWGDQSHLWSIMRIFDVLRHPPSNISEIITQRISQTSFKKIWKWVPELSRRQAWSYGQTDRQSCGWTDTGNDNTPIGPWGRWIKIRPWMMHIIWALLCFCCGGSEHLSKRRGTTTTKEAQRIHMLVSWEITF